MMERIRVGEDTVIPLEEIQFRASRSSGPGGQHANVTASRIEAIFDVEASEALTEEQRELLSAQARRSSHGGGPGRPQPGAQP